MVATKRINTLLAQPQLLEVDDLELVRELLEEHPYFQAAHSLYLKGLYRENSSLYNKALQRTAAHTTDRSVLFDFITSEDFIQNQVSERIKKLQDQSSEESAETDTEETFIKTPTLVEDLNANQDFRKVADQDLFEKKSLEEQPLRFDQNETHSFSQWLQLTAITPIDRSSERASSEVKALPEEAAPNVMQEMEERARKMARIDQFLSEKPKIQPVKSASTHFNLADQHNEPHTLMTETLAKVYLAQKNYSKAIKSYEILILQHPEKSGLFADQIQEIKNLQSNNT